MVADLTDPKNTYKEKFSSLFTHTTQLKVLRICKQIHIYNNEGIYERRTHLKRLKSFSLKSPKTFFLNEDFFFFFVVVVDLPAYIYTLHIMKNNGS